MEEQEPGYLDALLEDGLSPMARDKYTQLDRVTKRQHSLVKLYRQKGSAVRVSDVNLDGDITQFRLTPTFLRGIQRAKFTLQLDLARMGHKDLVIDIFNRYNPTKRR